MKKSNWIWIGLASAALIGGGIWLYLRNKKKQEESGGDEGSGDKGGGDGGSVTKISEEDLNKVDTDKTSTDPKKQAPIEHYPQTPFKNKEEGNKFRVWMNKNHSDFRFKGQKLDSTGTYDNDFMRKAYMMYGAEYTKAIVPPEIKLPASEFKYRDKVFISPHIDKVSLYSFPSLKGDWIKGYIDKNDMIDKPFGLFIGTQIQGKSDFDTWVKVKVVGYRKFDKSIVLKPHYFYILANKISKSPF